MKLSSVEVSTTASRRSAIRAPQARPTSMGLRARTDDDLRALLFTDGLSTRAVVSEISGRGVGLGAVLAIVRAHGGDATVESTAGEGTVFRFRLPRARRAA